MKDYLAYFNEVDKTPWGGLFYKLLWHQLDPYITSNMNILDYGSGFGKTANHFALIANVTAYEPNQEMLSRRYNSNNYQQFSGSFSTLKKSTGRKFDLIIVHNVLEYVPDIEKTLSELISLLNDDGILSIVKHNRLGHVFSRAVLNDDPKNALLEYKGRVSQSKNFGNINIYSNEKLEDILRKNNMTFKKVKGIRTVFGLSANSQVKEKKEWQETMYNLECVLEENPIAKQTAFFNHIIAIKKNYSNNF